jgi:hypothetical protein
VRRLRHELRARALRPPRGFAAVDGLTSALDDLFKQLAAVRRKFTVSFVVASDDLPAPYDREGGRPRDGAEEDDEDSEVDEPDGWEGEEPVEAEEDDDDR